MTVARIYARFSTERQDITSIADQLRVCRAHAVAQGWRIAAEYSDEAISGAALGNRPGAQAALRDLQHGEALLVNDLTRLARSQDLGPMIARLRFRGVRVIGAQDGFDSTSRTAGMQAGLSGIMSEEFRRQIADRTHSSAVTRARTGGKIGGKVYEDPAIVREIFERFDRGEGLRAIAGDLNARGVPSPGATWNREQRRSDGRWIVSALHAMLKNERYAGREVWNRSQWFRHPDTGVRHRRMRPPEEWIVRECPALIDRDLFERVQTRMRARGRAGGGPGGGPKYLLSGLLTCALCGSRMIVSGGSQHRYVCGLRHGGGAAACANGIGVPRRLAESLILQPVIEQLLSPEAETEGVKALAEHNAAPVGAQPEEVAVIERLVREGILSRETAAPSLAEARRKALQRAAESPRYVFTATGRAAWRAAVRDLTTILQGEDVAAARAALHDLLGTVICRPAPTGDHLIAELTACSVMLQTGSGRWIGSGGLIAIHLLKPPPDDGPRKVLRWKRRSTV